MHPQPQCIRRLAVAADVLKDTIDRGNITVLKPPSNDRVLLGLEDASRSGRA